MNSTKTLIVITGPTASGKSALAVRVAQRLQTEIISADSRQIFRRMPIATAVPTPEELAAVRHHFIETLEPEEYYSTSLFEAQALTAIEGVFREKDYCVACGGSMMYVDALCHGIDDMPDVPDNIRERLAQEWREYGDAPMRLRLLGHDPEHYSRVDLSNMKRVIHALEICLASGKPYSSFLTGEKRERPFRILMFVLLPDRETLFSRINSRVDRMVAEGLEEEARRLYPLRGINSVNTLGLKEMFLYLDGIYTMDEAVARIKKNTRVFAKKQEGWLRRYPDAVTIDPSKGDPLEIIMQNF